VSKKTKQPSPVGRPTDYRPNFHPSSYIDLCKQGKTRTQCCAEWGISVETFHAWQRKHPEFLDAIKEGDPHRESWWVEQGRTGMWAERFNASTYIWITKNTLKWTDRSEIKTEQNITVEGLSKKTDQEIIEEISSLAKSLKK